MITGPNSLSKRWACAIEWRRFRTLLLIDTLIGGLLFLLFPLQSERGLPTLLLHMIGSHAIGTSIYLLVHLTDIVVITHPWKRFFGLIAIFMLGGWIGTAITLSANALFMHLDIPFHTLFFWDTVLALFFGAAVNSYFVLRSNLEATAAELAEKRINEHQLLRLKTKAELEALRAKVNPHFLFNTLNSIASLIPSDPAKAEEMVQRLARLFRYTLEASSREMMKLEDELRLCREYLEIEKVRLGARLTFEITSEAGLEELQIPGLLLQPLIENSVKHGVSPSKTGGHIILRAGRNGDRCQIEIIDTGKGFDQLETNAGFGLNSVRERLALHYGEASAFEIETENGVRIRMGLPLRTHAHNNSLLEGGPGSIVGAGNIARAA